MTDWKSSLRADPIPWLLENACAPIRYRVFTELLDRSKDDPDVLAARQAVLEYPPAVALQRKQRKDGTWGGQIHAGDTKKLEPSVENALTLLYEMAWGRDTKPVRQAAATLRGFLTSKKDLKFFEFAKVVKADEKRECGLHARIRVHVAQPALQLQDLAEPLDVPSCEGQLADAGPRRPLRRRIVSIVANEWPAMRLVGKAAGDNQTPKQYGIGQCVRHALEAAAIHIEGRQ
jgi:hypothetical protein